MSSSSLQPEKRVLSQLPISPLAPIYHLKPDPLLPTPQSLFKLSQFRSDQPDAESVTLPSMVRRSRQITRGANYSFVSPLPVSFPYDIMEPGETITSVGADGQQASRPVTIEDRLAEFEPSLAHPIESVGEAPGATTAYTSPLRDTLPPATLLAFSKRCAETWLPQLDAGDASTCVLGAPGTAADVAKRDELVNVFAGRTMLAKQGDPAAETQAEKLGFAPYSLAYAGHQFGQFAGQLGDGRAISIYSTPTTDAVRLATGLPNVELQLKGAGRTPFSRFADGLAVLRSSIREFLGAEAMAALGVPTSRALALVGIPGVKVRRERMEGAAIVTRVASSWIRVGCFELPVYRQEWESLRLLTHFVARNVFMLSDSTAPTAPTSLALEVLRTSSKRNAVLFGHFQSIGFCHGVLNTDNISIVGDTIDFGPYAFMDIFDPRHVCNHSDEEGRYSFEKQPTMGMFAITKLGESLAALIGCELELAEGALQGYVAAPEGWREGADEDKIKAWTAAGMDKLADVKADFVTTFLAEYTRLTRRRLGLLTASPDSLDFDLVSGLLDLMHLHSLDFSSTIRLLSQFPGIDSPLLHKYFDMLLPTTMVQAGLQDSARTAWRQWFVRYEARLNTPEEKAASQADQLSRRERMNAVNPRFILRQWVLEETIEKVDSGKDVQALNRVLELSSEPFHAYGEALLEGEAQCSLDAGERAEEQEQARLCSMGSENMLGFQCSCSS